MVRMVILASIIAMGAQVAWGSGMLLHMDVTDRAIHSFKAAPKNAIGSFDPSQEFSDEEYYEEVLMKYRPYL